MTFPNTLEAWKIKIHPHDLNRTLEAFYKGVYGQEDLNVKYRFLTKNNQYHWIQMTGMLSKKENSLDFYLGIINDINI